MTAAELASRLHAHPAGPGRWRGYCPLHGGKSGKALDIREGQAGRTLLKCWRSCDKAQILRAAGLGWRDLFESPRQPQATYAIDARIRSAVDRVLENARRHPALRHTPVEVILCDAEHIETAIIQAIMRAVQGRAAQIGLLQEAEVFNAT